MQILLEQVVYSKFGLNYFLFIIIIFFNDLCYYCVLFLEIILMLMKLLGIIWTNYSIVGKRSFMLCEFMASFGGANPGAAQAVVPQMIKDVRVSARTRNVRYDG